LAIRERLLCLKPVTIGEEKARQIVVVLPPSFQNHH